MKTLILSLLCLPVAQEAENPDYHCWASCNVGSWVKMKSEIESHGNKMAMPSEMTSTLVELDDMKAVVEEVLVNLIAGKDSSQQEKPKKRTYKSTRNKKEAVDKEGDEEIEVAGKMMTCHRVEIKTAAEWSKALTHPDVPGGTVRLEMIFGSDKTRVARLLATSWEKK